MLTAYKIKDNYLLQINPSIEKDWLKDALWIDLVMPKKKKSKL
jgi:hypothetical protein